MSSKQLLAARKSNAKSMRRRAVTVLGIFAALAGTISHSDVARANLPSALFDKDEVDWASVRNLTSEAFAEDFEKRKATQMVVDLEVDIINGEQRVSAIWQNNPENRGWASLRNLTSDQFHDEWVKFKNAGYRLVDQESYLMNGTQYYAGVFIENQEGLNWASYRDVTSSEFSEKFDTYRDAGYIPVDFEVYETQDGERLSAVWVDNAEGLSWKLQRGLSSEQFSQVFKEYSEQGFRVVDFESYTVNGAQHYGAIFYENKNGRHWRERRDLTSKQFGDWWKRYLDAGYRLTDFEGYSTAEGQRHAGVWRQNSDRPSWQHKAAVDARLESEMEQFSVPGMSVVIMKNGESLYLRGLGYADVESKKIATSDTRYRLASVSKAVAGILALDLQERGLIDLDNFTSFYVPGLPQHHTHTVWQTVTNRSGIGHYDELGSPPAGNYTTALSAAATFWDQPLAVPPGTDKYSTHAYTVLGAALEGALGDDIFDIYENELRAKYGLGSVRPEDLSQPDAQRSSLYSYNSVTGTTTEVNSPDNLSWKVLGGGLEGSVKDMAQLVNKVFNGTILEPGSVDALWIPPDNASNYAYGWSVNTTSYCTPVVAKNGAQLGAKSYVQAFPELGIVTAVLTNRKTGGHNPGQVAIDIGNIILSTECR